MPKKIKGTPDAEVIAAPAGEVVLALPGEDTVIAGPAESLTTAKGGAGVDTLVLDLTAEEWQTLAPTLQAELDAYLAFLAENTNPTGQATGQWFTFESLNLKVKQFENVVLKVGGVEVTPEDDPVDAVDDLFELDNDETITGASVLVNDSVPDLVASVDLVSGPAKGSLTLNDDGTFDFDPGSDFDGLAADQTEDVTFTYRVTDTNGDEDVATVTITVSGTNTPPVADPDRIVVTESEALGDLEVLVGGAFSVLDNDSDVDGDVLSVVGVTAPSKGLVVVNPDGTVDFDANGDFEGLNAGESEDVTVSYTVSDGFSTTVGEITITVQGEDDPATLVTDTASVLAGGTVLVDVLANDSDPDDTLFIQDLVWLGSTGGTATVVDEKLQFDAGDAFTSLGAGAEQETVVFYQIVGDRSLVSQTGTLIVTVTGVNDGPTAEDDLAIGVSESTDTLIDVLANDTDPDTGDLLQITSVTQPLEGTVEIAPGGTAITFKPGTAFEGLSAGQTATVSFGYTITDGTETSSATVTVEVAGEGEFDPADVSDSDTITGINGQNVSATLTMEGQSNDGEADGSIRIDFGALAQPKIDLIFVIDTSGSTRERATAPNAPIIAGDLNGDNIVDGVIDLEIKAVLDLVTQVKAEGFPDGSVRVGLVSFNSEARNAGGVTFTSVDVDNNGETDDIQGLKQGFRASTLFDTNGFTDYQKALQTTLTLVNQFQTSRPDAATYTWFLSDGEPRTNTGIQPVSAFQALADQLKAKSVVNAIGFDDVGPPALNPNLGLNQIDSDGTAQIVTDPSGLSAALLESVVPSATVIDATLTAQDNGGGAPRVFTFTADPTDTDDFVFVQTTFGLRADLSAIDLGDVDQVGEAATVTLVVNLDTDSDGIADTPITTQVLVSGVLPDSFDFA